MSEVIKGDCIEVMSSLPSGSCSAVVTSPPYNLKSTTTAKTKSFWKNSKLMDEGYDGYKDNLPRKEYVEWQRACLTEMMRCIDDEGAIFYNHHWRTQKGLLQDQSEIVQGFPVRQIVIWNRQGGVNFNAGFFLPNYEVIYLIAKKGFKLANDANKWGAVWSIRPERGNPHPAPYPVELARRCVIAVGRGTILDPFFGSGTTGVAAQMAGIEYIGIEQSQKYIDIANNRLNTGTETDFFKGEMQ